MDNKREYSGADSGLMFILSLIVPVFCGTIILAVIKAVFPNINETLYYYLSIGLTQVLFLFSFLGYSIIKKVNIIKQINLKFNLNFIQVLLIIVIGLIAMYGFAPLVNYITYWLEQLGLQSSTFSGLNLSNFGYLILNIIIVALLPAICEELIFRGAILNGLKKYGAVVMIVISSVMFSIMHLNIQQTIYQLVLGAILASVVMITGSIISSMILHFFNNAVVLIINFITLQSGVVESSSFAPTNVLDHILPFIIAVISLGLIFLLLCLLKKCTKKPMYEIFNLTKKAKQTETKNININSEDLAVEFTDNKLESNSENIPSKVKTNKFDSNFLLVTISLIFGFIAWLAFVIMSFIPQ